MSRRRKKRNPQGQGEQLDRQAKELDLKEQEERINRERAKTELLKSIAAGRVCGENIGEILKFVGDDSGSSRGTGQSLGHVTDGGAVSDADSVKSVGHSMSETGGVILPTSHKTSEIEEPEGKVPRVLIGGHAYYGYQASEFAATIRASIAPMQITEREMPDGTKKVSGERVLLPDIKGGKSFTHGALSEIVGGVRELLRRRDQQEHKMELRQDGQSPEPTINQVVGVFKTVVFHTTVDAGKFKHLFVGYDPDKDKSSDVFTPEGFEWERKRHVKKITEKAAQQYDETGRVNVEGVSHKLNDLLQTELSGLPVKDAKSLADSVGENNFFQDEVENVVMATPIKGIMHNEKTRSAALKEDFKNVSLADAAALAKFVEEQRVDRRPKEYRELTERVGDASMKELKKLFTFITYDNQTTQLKDVGMSLKRAGVPVTPNEYLTEMFSWLSRDFALRSHQRYLDNTRAMPSDRKPYQYADAEASDDPEAVQKARRRLKPMKGAHSKTKQQLLDQPGFSNFERKMLLILKGWQNCHGLKGAAFGAGLPQWQYDFYDRVTDDYFLIFREREAAEPTFKTNIDDGGPSEFQRMNFMGHRLSNNYRCDSFGRPLGNLHAIDAEERPIEVMRSNRDGSIRDLVVDGCPTLPDAENQYLLGQIKDDPIPGYGLLAKEWRDKRPLSELSGIGVDILSASRFKGVRHLDQLDKDILDGEVNAERAASRKPVWDVIDPNKWIVDFVGEQELQRLAVSGKIEDKAGKVLGEKGKKVRTVEAAVRVKLEQEITKIASGIAGVEYDCENRKHNDLVIADEAKRLGKDPDEIRLDFYSKLVDQDISGTREQALARRILLKRIIEKEAKRHFIMEVGHIGAKIVSDETKTPIDKFDASNPAHLNAVISSEASQLGMSPADMRSESKKTDVELAVRIIISHMPVKGANQAYTMEYDNIAGDMVYKSTGKRPEHYNSANPDHLEAVIADEADRTGKTTKELRDDFSGSDRELAQRAIRRRVLFEGDISRGWADNRVREAETERLIEHATRHYQNEEGLAQECVRSEYAKSLATTDLVEREKDECHKTFGRESIDDSVKAAMEHDLTRRLAKNRFDYMVDRARYITVYNLARYSGKLGKDGELYSRNVFWKVDQTNSKRERSADVTDFQLIHKIQYELSRMPDEKIKVDGRQATPEEASRIRKYSFAILHNIPPANPKAGKEGRVTKILSTTDFRKMSSPDARDNPEWRMLVKDDLLLSDFTPEQREFIAKCVGERKVDGEIMFHTLMNIQRLYVQTQGDMLRRCVEMSNNSERFTDPETNRTWMYKKTAITEALKKSAPPGTSESSEMDYGLMRLNRLFGRSVTVQDYEFKKIHGRPPKRDEVESGLRVSYGDRLKALRGDLGNPYAPVGLDLLFKEDTRRDRESLLTSLEHDLFKNPEFKPIGDALRNQIEDPKEAVLHFYVFMQAVHVRYRGMGEHIRDTNTHGVSGSKPEKISADRLFDSVSNAGSEGKLRISLHQMSPEEAEVAVRSPRSRNEYADTIIYRGVSVDGGAWANEQDAIKILSQDPFSRKYMLELAKNNAAYRRAETHVRISGGDRDRLSEIMDSEGLSPDHEARKKLAGGASIKDTVEELKKIKTNSLSETAKFLGVKDDEPTRENLEEWLKFYSDALLQSRMGNLKNAVGRLDEAFKASDQMQYSRPDTDLRQVTLNKRGWLKMDIADSTPADRKTRRAMYQDSLDDFTASWLISRGEETRHALVPSRYVWNLSAPMHWISDRFTNVQKEFDERENPESIVGIASANSRISGFALVASVQNRRRVFQTAAASAFTGTAVTVATVAGSALASSAAPVVIPAAAFLTAGSIAAASFDERLNLSKKWLERAEMALEHRKRDILAPDVSRIINNEYQGRVPTQSSEISRVTERAETESDKSYLLHHYERTVGLKSAQTYTAIGDRSWFRFLRQAAHTYQMDNIGIMSPKGMECYEKAAQLLDPHAETHILHASSVSISEGRSKFIKENLNEDTYHIRAAKRHALERRGWHFPASWGALNVPHETAYDRLSEEEHTMVRQYEDFQRTSGLEKGWFGTLADMTYFLGAKFQKRAKMNSLLYYMENHKGDEDADGAPRAIPGTPASVGANNRAAILLRQEAHHLMNDEGEFLPRGQRYFERARELWQTALEKWSYTFQKDQPIPKADANRELIENGILMKEDKDPVAKHK